MVEDFWFLAPVLTKNGGHRGPKSTASICFKSRENVPEMCQKRTNSNKKVKKTEEETQNIKEEEEIQLKSP